MALRSDLNQLLSMFAKLPGLGQRSARRIVLHFFRQRNHEVFVEKILDVMNRFHPCSICGYIDQEDPCFFCTSSQRMSNVVCVVAETGDVWAMEKMGIFRGCYHVLGGVLSSFYGNGPEKLFLTGLLDRLPHMDEIILAFDGNLEGQTTLHYVSQFIKEHAPNIKISSLARGLPMGSELDYLDQGTLSSAFLGRQSLSMISQDIGHWIQHKTDIHKDLEDKTKTDISKF